jgi:glycosyltransferase involved in cell wall biosynthesis
VTHYQRSQAILVRDLPLALTAILVGKCLKVPVIIDMAENYPSMLRDSRKLGRFRRTDILVRNVQFAKLVEWLTLRGVKKVIVVAEENRERLLEKGVPANDIYLVRNTPDLDMLDNSRDYVEPSEKMRFMDRFTLAYIGALGPVRGLEMVVEAMPRIIQEIPKAHLLLIGKGEREPILQKLVNRHKIADHVTFKGWLDFHHVPGYLRLAKVGIIPHRSTEHTNSTIPNKIFDYMALGLPVVASDIRPLRRIIAEENCGITFQAGNTDAFVSAVTRMYEGNEGNTFGENGRRAVERKYSWNEDSMILLKVFADLEASVSGPPKGS